MNDRGFCFDPQNEQQFKQQQSLINPDTIPSAPPSFIETNFQNQTVDQNSIYSQQGQQYQGSFQQKTIPKTFPVYRYVSTTPHYKYYFTSTSYSCPVGFTLDKPCTTFSGVNQNDLGVIAIHRYKCIKDPKQGYCYVHPREFSNSREWMDDGIVCYLYAIQVQGTVPIYRQYPVGSAHREVLNFGQEQSGWKNIAIVGYGYQN